MTPSRRTILQGTAAGILTLAAKNIWANDFPQRPVRIVVPYAPGGITDIISRLIAEQASTVSPGMRMIVDNRPGAAGLLGTTQVARATPDGHTILMGAISPLVIARIAAPNLAYDPFQDFVPITQVATAPVVLVVHTSVPVNNAAELVDLIKQNPDKYNYSSAGAGAPSHLAYELFTQRYQLDMAHIPYKGTGASLIDLAAGQVHLTMDSAAGLLPFIQSGRLKPLAVASASRSPLLPDVPTMAQAGLGDFEVSGWYGYLAPADTPEAIVATLADMIHQVVALPAITQRFNELGVITKTSSPAAFGQFIRAEYERWQPIVQALDLKFG